MYIGAELREWRGPEVRAVADSWKREPFIAGIAIPYQDSFSGSEYAKLQEGLIPEAMEDKWFIYFEEPYLFLHRSWTGKPASRVRFAVNGERLAVSEALCVSDLLQQNGPDYQARLLDFLVSNLLLAKAKPFPLPEGLAEPTEGVFQHHVAGTGYPQS